MGFEVVVGFVFGVEDGDFGILDEEVCFGIVGGVDLVGLLVGLFGMDFVVVGEVV